MSFFIQRAVCYFIDEFHYYLLIGYIKMSEMLKHQQFENSESEKTKTSVMVSKYQ